MVKAIAKKSLSEQLAERVAQSEVANPVVVEYVQTAAVVDVLQLDIDTVGDILVVVQRQIPRVHGLQEKCEISQVQHNDKEVGIPAVQVMQVPQVPSERPLERLVVVEYVQPASVALSPWSSTWHPTCCHFAGALRRQDRCSSRAGPAGSTGPGKDGRYPPMAVGGGDRGGPRSPNNLGCTDVRERGKRSSGAGGNCRGVLRSERFFPLSSKFPRVSQPDREAHGAAVRN